MIGATEELLWELPELAEHFETLRERARELLDMSRTYNMVLRRAKGTLVARLEHQIALLQGAYQASINERQRVANHSAARSSLQFPDPFLTPSRGLSEEREHSQPMGLQQTTIILMPRTESKSQGSRTWTVHTTMEAVARAKAGPIYPAADAVVGVNGPMTGGKRYHHLLCSHLYCSRAGSKTRCFQEGVKIYKLEAVTGEDLRGPCLSCLHLLTQRGG